jgi:hypothetical protein
MSESLAYDDVVVCSVVSCIAMLLKTEIDSPWQVLKGA